MPYTEDLLKIWQRVIENFGDSMPRATIENMFYDIVVESFDGEVAVLSMHSEYRHSLIVKNILKKSSLISGQVGRQISIVFKYSGSSKTSTS